MQLPKYKFYVGSLLEPSYYANSAYNSEGERVTSEGDYASEIVWLPSGSSDIYINAKSIYTPVFSRLIFFDSTRSFLSMSTGLYNYSDGDQLIPVPDGARYVAMNINAADSLLLRKVTAEAEILFALQQFTPSYKELSKKYKKEDNQIFFRTELDGDVKLVGTPFDYVYNSDIETKFIMLITKYSLIDAAEKTYGWAQYYKGTFVKTDCEFDYMKKTCVPELTTLDEYNKVLDKYDNTYDLIKLAPATSTVHLNSRPMLQVYIAGGDLVTNYLGNIYYETDANDVIDDQNELINTYHFSLQDAIYEIHIDEDAVADLEPDMAGYYACVSPDMTFDFNNWPAVEGIYWELGSNQKGYTMYARLFSGNGTLGDTSIIKAELWIRRDSDSMYIATSASIDTTYVSSQGYYYLDSASDLTMEYLDTNTEFTLDYLIANTIFQRVLCNLESININGTQTSTYEVDSDDFALPSGSTYKRCIGYRGNTFLATTTTTTESTKWGQNDDGEYFTNDFVSSVTGINHLLPVCRNSWVNVSIWVSIDSLYLVSWEPALRYGYDCKDTYSIAAVIKALLQKIDPSLQHEATAEYSQFLYADTNPIQLDKFWVYITQKSNILAGNYDQPAQTAETTLEDIMNMLQKCFRCYWYIEDGKFKVEHIYYFMNGRNYTVSAGVQLDFTELTDQFNKKPTAYYQSEIEYNKDDLASRYEFSWADDTTDLFGNFAIDVDSHYIQSDDTEDVSESNFCSDIDLMLLTPDEFSDDGFALLCPVINSSGAYELPIPSVSYFKDENGDAYTTTTQNFYASWLYLANCYMLDMPARNISSDSLVDGTLVVRDIKKCMKHTIEFPSEDDPDDIMLIRTDLGDGTIDEMTINLDTRMAEVDLVYRPT